MAVKTVVAGSTVSASQLKDLMRQIEDGSLGAHEMQALLEHRNPFTFERNKHGHVVITFVGLDLTGAQEIERLEGLKFNIGNYPKFCLRSKEYVKKHRLVAQQVYKVALMPGKEIEGDVKRTTHNLRDRGMKQYGYGEPIAGLSPRVRESLTDKQMEDLGIWYVATLHDPIENSGGVQCVLRASRDGDGRYLDACDVRRAALWDGLGSFAFLVPASTQILASKI